jgi:hypothetical protein
MHRLQHPCILNLRKTHDMIGHVRDDPLCLLTMATSPLQPRPALTAVHALRLDTALAMFLPLNRNQSSQALSKHRARESEAKFPSLGK